MPSLEAVFELEDDDPVTVIPFLTSVQDRCFLIIVFIAPADLSSLELIS